MATPFIVRVLPAGAAVGTAAEGPTAGRSLVEIYGGNFRLPIVPAIGSGPSGPVSNGLVKADTTQTVSVTFGGVDAVSVEVIRSNLLHVITPISPIAAEAPAYGSGAVDVAIANLDDLGVPIAGETVTLANGYTYSHPKLDATTTHDLTRLVKNFIREWKRQVLPNVSFTTHVDYDSDTLTAFVDIATTPAIVLQLTESPESRFYSRNEPLEEYVGNELVEVSRKPRTVDLHFDVLGISDSMMELINLMAAANEFMDRNPYFSMDRSESDPALGQASWELDYRDAGGFTVGSRPNNSSIRYFSGSIVIRGFDVSGFAGFVSDSLHALTTRLQTDVSLDAEIL